MPDADIVLARAAAAAAAGNHACAEKLLRDRLAVEPAEVNIQVGLAVLAHRAGVVAASIICFRRAIAIAPFEASLQANLGILLGGQSAGRPMRRAVALAPGLPDGHANLAGLGVLPTHAQILWCRRALAVSPGHHAASINLGLALSGLGRPAEALPFMQAAVNIAPLSVDAHYTLGGLNADCGRLADAMNSLKRGAALSPQDSGMWLRISRVACSASELRMASTAGGRAVAIDPADATARSNRLMVALYDERVAPQRILRLASERHSGARPSPPARRDRPAGRPLHVAYLSADFRNHPIAYNIAPVIAAHDRSRVHVSCYADVIHRDAMTVQIAGSADRWIEINGRTDISVAEDIANSGVDILVLLAGHTANNRLGLARHRAADVQVSMLDVASSGSPDIDAIVVDSVLSPASDASAFSEERTFVSCLFCFTAPEDAPAPGRRDDGRLVFGSFSNPAKIGAATVALWAPLLRALPGARLLLKYKNLYGDPMVQAGIAGRFAEAGVDTARIDFRSDLDTRHAHLESYQEIDIALDPIPFNGCTTTFEALWMGVPVLSTTADRMMGRMGASILTAAGLAELVAKDADDLASIGARLVIDRARRTELRRDLRGRLRGSRLVDGRPLAREIEDVFERIVERRAA
jgi:predicted O-linked N-acetylglucosamine transferase (SPINDLY family)